MQTKISLRLNIWKVNLWLLSLEKLKNVLAVYLLFGFMILMGFGFQRISATHFCSAVNKIAAREVFPTLSVWSSLFRIQAIPEPIEPLDDHAQSGQTGYLFPPPPYLLHLLLICCIPPSRPIIPSLDLQGNVLEEGLLLPSTTFYSRMCKRGRR